MVARGEIGVLGFRWLVCLCISIVLILCIGCGKKVEPLGPDPLLCGLCEDDPKCDFCKEK